MQCSELTRNELDLVLLGQISALLSSDPDTAANNQRKRSNMAFYHGGARICRITFQKLHGIGTMISEHAHVLTCTHTHTCTHNHTIPRIIISFIHTHMHAHTYTIIVPYPDLVTVVSVNH